jgi:hypothetical protein
MAKIAAIVLGGIVLVLWALERYHEKVETYWQYKTAASALRNNIFVQQQQLRTTLGLIRLGHPGFNELRECLEEKYPSQHKETFLII